MLRISCCNCYLGANCKIPCWTTPDKTWWSKWRTGQSSTQESKFAVRKGIFLVSFTGIHEPKPCGPRSETIWNLRPDHIKIKNKIKKSGTNRDRAVHGSPVFLIMSKSFTNWSNMFRMSWQCSWPLQEVTLKRPPKRKKKRFFKNINWKTSFNLLEKNSIWPNEFMSKSYGKFASRKFMIIHFIF